MSADQSRIIELESKLAFLEHTVATLNEVVIEQEKKIEALERALREVCEEVHRVE